MESQGKGNTASGEETSMKRKLGADQKNKSDLQKEEEMSRQKITYEVIH